MKSIWTIIFILVLTCTFGQVQNSNDTSIIKTRGNPVYFIDGVRINSDTCNKAEIQELERNYYKTAKRHKKKKIALGPVAYQIAECYRLKNDTAYLSWYKRTIEISKSAYINCDKNEIKHHILSQTGYSYYYIKDYQMASVYFNKAISFCRIRDALKDVYYLGLCLIELKQYSEAIVEFNNYIKIYPTDKKDTENLIKYCKDKINSK